MDDEVLGYIYRRVVVDVGRVMYEDVNVFSLLEEVVRLGCGWVYDIFLVGWLRRLMLFLEKIVCKYVVYVEFGFVGDVLMDL